MNQASKIPKNLRTRIAPSPTGFLHIGTARTALINYICAKQNNGHFILRIEDTDLLRSDLKFEQDIIEGLKWLGILWDEGPDIGGEHGPYRQTQRTDTYKKYIKQLLAENKAYHCFCDEKELEQQRELMMAEGVSPKYSGKCASRTKEDAEEKIKKGEKSIIRFRVPNKKIIFHDLIKGKIEFNTELMGDITIAKNEDTPLYNFAVVVDDYEMKINLVIRGEDHVSNTPKQILMQAALEFNTPIYAHLPLVLGSDKRKLSKREGAVSIIEYRNQGYLPEAMINFLILMGWNPGTDREVFSMDDLVEEFKIEKFQKSGAIFNIQKLNWLNSYYIRQKDIAELTELCLPYLEQSGLIKKENGKYITSDTNEEISAEWLGKIISLEKERIKTLSDISGAVDFFFFDIIKISNPAILIWKKSDKEKALQCLGETLEAFREIEFGKFEQLDIKTALQPLVEKYGNGDVYWPLRVALSGKGASPGPLEIAEVLGKDKTVRRLKYAIDALSNK